MFLALRVTNYPIHLPHAVVLGRRIRESDKEETLDDQRAAKRSLIEKIREEFRYLERDDLWRRVERDERLNNISRSDLTRLLSSAQSVKYSAQEIFFSRPDFATQG